MKADFVNECQHEDKKAQHGSTHIQRILKGVFLVVIELKKVLIVKRKGTWYKSYFFLNIYNKYTQKNHHE